MRTKLPQKQFHILSGFLSGGFGPGGTASGKKPHTTGVEIVDAAGDLNFTRALQVAQDWAQLADAFHREPDP